MSSNTSHPDLFGLYAITPTQLTTVEHEAELLKRTEIILNNGARILQYRDKTKDATKRLRQANALKKLCDDHDAVFIINDDIQLAQACNADGVHLGQSDGSLEVARETLGREAIIGITCHNRIDLAQAAQDQGASYVAFGAFFPSSTKPDAIHAPMDLISQAREHIHLPICAIGGITTDNAHQLMHADAPDMLAVVSDVYLQDDIAQQARTFARFFKS